MSSADAYSDSNLFEINGQLSKLRQAAQAITSYRQAMLWAMPTDYLPEDHPEKPFDTKLRALIDLIEPVANPSLLQAIDEAKTLVELRQIRALDVSTMQLERNGQ